MIRKCMCQWLESDRDKEAGIICTFSLPFSAFSEGADKSVWLLFMGLFASYLWGIFGVLEATLPL